MISPILSIRLKRAKELQAKNQDCSIVYDIVCSLSDELPIECTTTIEEAREHIAAVNEEYLRIDGCGIRLFIRPMVIDQLGRVVR